MGAKPEPKVITEVCSLCGLDWKRHGKSPTTEKCIELLLSEVRSLNAQLATRPIPWLRPYVVPQPLPYRPWPQPFWTGTWGGQYQYASNATAHTPQLTSSAVLASLGVSGVPRGRVV